MSQPLGRRAPLLLAVLFLLGWVWLEPARADTVQFSVDYGYSVSSSETSISETRNSDGTIKTPATTSKGSSDLFSQEYRVFFDKMLYPNLVLRGGGSFASTESSSESDGVSSGVSTNIRKNPFLDLTLGSPMISASLGVNRYQDEARNSGEPRTVLTRDMYTAFLGWKPLDLPSFSLRTTHTESYDDSRQTMNTVQDHIQFGSGYQPHKTVSLSYLANFNRNQDLLGDTESISMDQSGRASYEDSFFRRLVSLSSTYAVSQSSSEITSGGAGTGGDVELDTEVPLFIKKYTDKFPEDPIPQQPINLFPTTSRTVTASLVLPLIPPPNLDPLNIALDFVDKMKVNVVRVNVDQALPLGWDASFFDFKVFGVDVSNNWNLSEIILQSKTFKSEFGRHYFELRFLTQEVQYLKVVVTPRAHSSTMVQITGNSVVTPANPNLYYAVEALYRQVIPVGTAGGATTVKSISPLAQMYNLNLASRIRLLENPGLDYSFSMFYRLSNPGHLYRLYVSNGSFLSHRLTPWLSGNVMFGRDDAMQTGQKDPDIAYRYGASFNVHPLPTLSSNLNYSGRKAQQSGTQMSSNAFSINNRAVLYPGLDLLLGGVYSLSSQASNAQSQSTQVNAGLSIAPHRTVSANLTGFASTTTSSGGGRADSTSSERRGQISASYSPVSALSIFVSSDVVTRDDSTQTLQNYGLSWSPFRDGTVQVGFSYFETLQPESEAVSRVLSPNLSWKISRSAYLDLNYAMIISSTPSEETTATSFGARLRATF